uniref:Uncharacterized protein n=2 Tax=Physcomitrium patens TaxID=3218 RepID=A0A2K1KZJ6_PHYPA|nr:hypothetical protein PHYPA_001989 [Physcomitrium patens]
MERCLKYPPSKFLANIGFIFWSAILLAPCADATASGVENPLAETHDHERSRRPWSTSGKYTAHKNFEEHFVSGRRLAGLVAPKPLVLPYHNGPILSRMNNVTKLYVIYYGAFTRIQRLTVRRFFRSLAPPRHRARASIPTVAKWWEITKGYQDVWGESVAQLLIPSGEIEDKSYSRGRTLDQRDIEALLLKLPHILSNQGFCQEACGQHAYLYPSGATGGQMLPYVWVGDASTQCPGLCCWPFANLNYTFMENSQDKPLLPPSGEVGVDGMIINLAKLIAGAATDPYQNAYYQGDAAAPVEAAEACSGIFGCGAYAGYPGSLMKDPVTGSSFNSFGSRGYKFLLPWMWDPKTFTCAGQSHQSTNSLQFDLNLAC